MLLYDALENSVNIMYSTYLPFSVLARYVAGYRM